VAHPN